ncbi:MAG TPA: VWA domain-containing protein [Actinomycetota bacterium]|nr:VWA domain-containing protein [Actinomycetota bacterium]
MASSLIQLAHPALGAVAFLAPVAAVAIWLAMPPPLSRRRGRLSLGIHLLVLLLLAAAIGGLAFARAPHAQSLVAVVDRSASTAGGAQQETEAVAALQRTLTGANELGVVTTGEQALVEQPPAPAGAAPAFTTFQTSPDADFTDLEAGLRLGASVMPTTTLQHIVVVSDGQQNLGDAVSEARSLRSQGVRVDVLPVAVPTGAEARVDSVHAPSSLPAGASTQVQVVIDSNVTQTAALSVSVDQTQVYQAPVSLGAGQTTVNVPLPPAVSGFHSITAQISPPQDTYAQNNVGAALLQVTGPERVLVVEGAPGQGANVANALKAAALNPTTVPPAAVPATLAGLAAYSAVALVNVPASALSAAQMGTLQAGVRDLGTGLAAFGGQDSLGPGGYAGTPLDSTLPVSAQLPQQLKKPPVAVVLCLETMEDPQADVVERGAAVALVNQLTPQDFVGITDGASGLAVPLQSAANKSAIDNAIQTMSFGDPSTYSPFLNEAAKALSANPGTNLNANKFIVLVGDGDASDDYNGEGKALAAQGISASAVGINVHSQSTFMTNMQAFATGGGGDFFESDNPSQLPQLLLQESQKSLKPWVVQGSFTPALHTASPALGGVNPSTLPPIDAYVAETTKPAAQDVLTSPAGDPVLATWQYGLGRAATWTSDTDGLWTRALLASPQSGTLLANIVAWTLPTPSDSALNLQTSVQGNQGAITAQLATSTALPAGAQVVATVAGPDLSGVQVPLTATGPGTYVGNFPAGQTGSYLVHVSASSGGTVLHSTLGGVAIAYSPEYQFLGTNAAFLRQLATAGGGTVLPSAAAAYRVRLPRLSVSEALTAWLLALAALLVPIDIAARRLVVSRADTKVWAEAVRPPAAPAEVEPTLLRLRGRLDRRAGGAEKAKPEPATPSAQPAEEPEDLAARLLAKRKKQP